MVSPLISAEREPEIVVGLQTTNILYDNPGKKLIAPQVGENQTFIRGGSFDVSQPGIEIRMDIPYQDKYFIPVGFNYTFFSARELIPVNNLVESKWRHNLDVFSVFSGLYYIYYSFDRINVDLYAGGDIRGSYIWDINFENELIYQELPDQSQVNSPGTKDEVFRLGTTIKTGVKSKFKGYLNLDISLGYTFFNILPADEKRGELFTPETQFETGESLVHTLNVNILMRFFL